MNSTRTIIIVWTWKSKGLGEGSWQIAGSSHEKDQVVCLDLLAAEHSVLELKTILEQYTRNDGEAILLLHRHHGYHQDHVKSILTLHLPSSHGKFQCYLFGEGADAIYLTNDPRGLLGTAGSFSASVNFEGQQMDITAIADADRRELKPAHFNHAWQLYQHALRKRIFELKEDLLDYLGQFLPKTEYLPGEMYHLLCQAENRVLLLRLLSFVGRIRKHSDLAKEIRTFERNNNRTLTFDDCGVQLGVAYNEQAAEQYAIAAAYILRHVLATGENVQLIELRKQLEDLLLLIPEPTYYS